MLDLPLFTFFFLFFIFFSHTHTHTHTSHIHTHTHTFIHTRTLSLHQTAAKRKKLADETEQKMNKELLDYLRQALHSALSCLTMVRPFLLDK